MRKGFSPPLVKLNHGSLQENPRFLTEVSATLHAKVITTFETFEEEKNKKISKKF
jgi:hypothetical protein